MTTSSVLSSQRCIKCLEVKPVEEFYFQSGSTTKRFKKCKDCIRKEQITCRRSGKVSAPRKMTSGCPEEQIVIEKLNSMGIFAVAGSSSPYKWADIVVWGCIRIEVKTCVTDSNADFTF